MATHKKTFQKVDFLLMQHLCDAAYLLKEVERQFKIEPRHLAVISFLAKSDTRARMDNIKHAMLDEPRTMTHFMDEIGSLVRRGYVEVIPEQPGQMKNMRAWRLTRAGFELVNRINTFVAKKQASRIL